MCVQQQVCQITQQDQWKKHHRFDDGSENSMQPLKMVVFIFACVAFLSFFLYDFKS